MSTPKKFKEEEKELPISTEMEIQQDILKKGRFIKRLVVETYHTHNK